MTDQRQALLALLEQQVECRHCGELMVPNYTREDLCHWCWRNANPEAQAFRVAHTRQTKGRVKARKGAK